MPVFQSTRLLDQLREQIRYLHYSLNNFKIPKRCFVCHELPRNIMVKVQKNLLRKQFKGFFA